jgi:hypothetical protein
LWLQVSWFILLNGQKGTGRADTEVAWIGVGQGRGWKRTFDKALAIWKSKSGKPVWNRRHTEPVALLLADAELGNYGFIPFRVVLLKVVKQAATPAHHHEKSAARAVVFQVRFEMIRQLTNAFAQQRDLDFGTAGIGRVRAIRVNDGLLLLSG